MAAGLWAAPFTPLNANRSLRRYSTNRMVGERDAMPVTPEFWPTNFADWAEAVRNVGLVAGGIAAFGVAAWALHLNRLRTRNDGRRLANDAQRLITDTYVKAIEQLGHGKMEVRLGAIYALERIARDAEDFDLHWSIMETLCAYVRERPASEWGKKAEQNEDQSADVPIAKNVSSEKRVRPPTDIQAILSVLHRRSDHRKMLEQEKSLLLNFRFFDWTNANLHEIHLDGADLVYTYFNNSNLAGSSFIGCDMRGATFNNAHLFHTDLTKSLLGHAKFNGADLTCTNFTCSDLVSAYLNDADLRWSILQRAVISSAYVRAARFSKHPKELGAIWDKERPPIGLNEIVIAES